MTGEGSAPRLTIADALRGFLRDALRRAPARYSRTRQAAHDLHVFIHAAGNRFLSPAGRERYGPALADAILDFPEIVGTEELPLLLSEYLDRHVVTFFNQHPDLGRDGPPLARRFAEWLARHRAADRRELEAVKRHATRVRRQIPQARRVARIARAAASPEFGREVHMGFFIVERVAYDRIWTVSWHLWRPFGPLPVPPDVAAVLEPGWLVTGSVGWDGSTYRFREFGHVYPPMPTDHPPDWKPERAVPPAPEPSPDGRPRLRLLK